MGLALAPDGRLFVADRDGSKVWVVSAAGQATIFAGTTPGDGGDGAAATLAKLNGPEAIAFAPDGSLYIADTGNQKIRRVAPDGTISTVAGTGQAGFSPGGPALSAPLSSPEGVAVDLDGSLYIADTMNHRIVRVTPAGLMEPVLGGPDPGQPERMFISLITQQDLDTGGGCALLYQPAGIAFDGKGNLYIADRHNHRIRVLWGAAKVHGPGQPGDVNEDGVVNIQDGILALRIIVQGIKVTDCRKSLADVAPHPGTDGRPAGNGTVDTTDAIRILRRAVGFIKDSDWP
jgi:DNA-binding beta-propeller fold protein YncE